MNILFIVEHYYPYIGGAENLWKSLSESLVKADHTVTVLTTRFDSSLPTSETINGVSVHRVNVRSRFLFTAIAVFKAVKLAKRADIIHTASYNAAIPAFVSAKIRKIPCVITFHELWGRLWLSLPFMSKWMLRLFYIFESIIRRLPFHVFVAVSQFTGQRLMAAGVPKSRVKVIYNGIDYDTFKNVNHSPTDTFTCCFIGRPGISKGIDVLLEGLSIYAANSNNKQVHLKMITSKKPKSIFNQIKSLVRSYGLEPYISFHHELDRVDLLQEMTTSHCVIIPSYSEGFCYVAAESVACDIPIISSARSALTETVSGKFIEMSALTGEALADALVKASQDNYNTKPKKHFHLRDTVGNYISLYKTLL